MNKAQTGVNPGADDGVNESGAPDLQSQLETLLNAVWDSERWAQTEDRIDAAVRYGTILGPSRHSRAA
jgi:hypothetical protein